MSPTDAQMVKAMMCAGTCLCVSTHTYTKNDKTNEVKTVESA